MPKPDTKKAKEKLFIFVDGEKFEPESALMTPNAIIVAATGLDTATHYLLMIKGHEKESYRDKGDIQIDLHKADKFQVLSTGPTTVSGV